MGPFRKDRASGVFANWEAPLMIPVKINLHTIAIAPRLSIKIANDSFLTPLLLNITVFNNYLPSERALGDSTIAIKAKSGQRSENVILIDVSRQRILP